MSMKKQIPDVVAGLACFAIAVAIDPGQAGRIVGTLAVLAVPYVIIKVVMEKMLGLRKAAQ